MNCKSCDEKDKRIGELQDLVRRMSDSYDAIEAKATDVSNVFVFPCMPGSTDQILVKRKNA